MPLIDLKTDLKSLKYGADRPGGGNSGQPYMKVDINTVDRGLNRVRFSNLDDGLVRGGFVGALNASIVDTLRIGKWLTDLPKGPLWIAKQVGLQLSNPKLETIKFPTGPGVLGTLGKLANTIQDKVGLGPTRLYNLGINTLAQVPVNAFGVHFNRHGLLPIQDDSTKYLNVAYTNNKSGNNRLVGLTNKFNLGTAGTKIVLNRRETGTFLSTLLNLGEAAANFVLTNTILPEKSSKIDDYFGGPDSVYGIGRTLIKRYDYTRTVTQAKLDKQNPNKPQIEVNLRNDLVANGPSIQEFNLGYQLPTNQSVKTYQQIKNRVNSLPNNSIYKLNESKNTALGTSGLFGAKDKYNGVIEAYTNNTVEYDNGIDAKVRLRGSWATLNRETRIGSGRQDQINLTPVFSYTAGTLGDDIVIPGVGVRNINDLVKFRIQALNGNDPNQSDWMIFRAYLTQLSDSTDAAWNPTKYNGRGEDFYIYNGFSRKISIGFKVAALSAQEMKPMYQKLNYLMGNVMPDYSEQGLMRGPLVKMTIGNWIDGQDGILNNINYTVPQDSPWEIGLKINGKSEPLILPHVVEVSMTFIPIGSQTKGVNKISSKSYNTSHIAQNYNQNDPQYIEGEIQKYNGVPRISVPSNYTRSNEDINFGFLAENAG